MTAPVTNPNQIYLPKALAELNLQTGTATLAAGTVTVTGVVLTANSVILMTPNTPAGGTQGVKYKIPVASRTATQFVVTAVDNAGATVATDTSTFDFLIVG